MTPAEMLALLKSDEAQALFAQAAGRGTRAEIIAKTGQDAIAKAAGKGVHNQPLGASLVTIGQAIQTTARTTTATAGAVAAIPEATVAELGDATRTVEEQAALLRAVLGDRAAEVCRLLSGQA